MTPELSERDQRKERFAGTVDMTVWAYVDHYMGDPVLSDPSMIHDLQLSLRMRWGVRVSLGNREWVTVFKDVGGYVVGSVN